MLAQFSEVWGPEINQMVVKKLLFLSEKKSETVGQQRAGQPLLSLQVNERRKLQLGDRRVTFFQRTTDSVKETLSFSLKISLFYVIFHGF